MKSFQKLFQQKENAELIKKASDSYGFKSAIDKFKNLYLLSRYSRILFGLVSILGGFYFVFEKFNQFIPFKAISAGVAVLILIAIEAFKHESVKLVFTEFNKGVSMNKFFFCVIVILAGAASYGSFVFSVQGITKVHQKYDQIKQRTLATYQNQKDSINTLFNTRINTVEQQIQDYKNQVSYRGKINIHNKANQKILTDYQQTLAELRNQKSKELQSLYSSFSESKNKARNSFDKNAKFWFVAAACNEGFILIIVFFISYYLFIIYKEKEIVLDQSNMTDPDETLKIVELITQHLLGFQKPINTGINTVIPVNEVEPTIGFKQPEKPINTRINTPINQPKAELSEKEKQEIKNREFLKKWQNVVDELQKPETERLSLNGIAKATGASKSTVQNVQRVLKNL